MKNFVNALSKKRFLLILSATALLISCSSKNNQSADGSIEDSVTDNEIVYDTAAVTETREYFLEDEVPISFSDGTVTLKVKDIVDQVFGAEEKEFFKNTAENEISFELDHFAEITSPNPLSILKTGEGCSDAAMLRFTRKKGDESYIDWILITKDAKGKLVFSKATANVTEMQNTATANINFENELANGCPVVTITEESEGGDVDLGKNKTLTMYAVSDGKLKKIFTLTIEDYVSYAHWAEKADASGDSTAADAPEEYSGEKSTLREIELSESRTLGMADLIVTTKVTRNKKVTDDYKEIYRWNGAAYVVQKGN